MIRRFIRANVALSGWIERRLPRRFNVSLLKEHERAAAELMNAAPGLTVVDVGGGHKSPFALHRRPDRGTRILSLDISEEQLRRNETADHTVLADVTAPFPLATDSADLLVTRSVLEHLRDNRLFFAECRRVLRPGGHCVHVLPCRFSPFALINQALPHALSQRLIHFIYPQWKDDVGFRTYYRSCWHPKISRLLEEHGFEVTELRLRYYQSVYYRFFVPLYLLFLAYDLLLWGLDARPLCCQMLVVARRR